MHYTGTLGASLLSVEPIVDWNPGGALDGDQQRLQRAVAGKLQFWLVGQASEIIRIDLARTLNRPNRPNHRLHRVFGKCPEVATVKTSGGILRSHPHLPWRYRIRPVPKTRQEPPGRILYQRSAVWDEDAIYKEA